MCIFQSEQLTKCPGFLKRMAPSSPVLSPLDYNMWGAMLGRC